MEIQGNIGYKMERKNHLKDRGGFYWWKDERELLDKVLVMCKGKQLIH